MFVIEESKLRKIIRTEYMQMMIESMKLDEEKQVSASEYQRARALVGSAKAALKMGDKQKHDVLMRAARAAVGRSEEKPSIDEMDGDSPLAQVQDPSLRRRSREVNRHGGFGKFSHPPDTELEDDYLATIGQSPGEEDSDLYGVEDPLKDPMYDLDERG